MLFYIVPLTQSFKFYERFLRSQAQPKYVREAVKEAFKLEPLNNAYGILQAITRVSTAARTDPDRQLDFEHLGGEYLLQMTQEVQA
jgi:hemin uptake protein HemP